MSFFSWTMRRAAILLFVYGLFALVVTLVMQIDSFGRMGIDYGPGIAGSGIFRFLAAVMGAFGAALWPLFGAAFLWRIDIGLRRLLPAQPAEIAE